MGSCSGGNGRSSLSLSRLCLSIQLWMHQACALQVPQPGCGLQGAAEGGYVRTRQWSPLSSHRSADSCGCKAAAGTIADSSEQKSLAERTEHQQWCVMYHVTLGLFSVAQEDLEVQRDESGSDKAVQA